ncbi:hypothetical protein [Pelotalea chapellei]|uniref:hypothetical protein n=1 Tax=Pelotalea chapellei TaxID=44671 RepID=UPI001FE65C05|nr:hypothetical protein [Pelotalea chapellei]
MLATILKKSVLITAVLLMAAAPAIAHEGKHMTKETPKAVELRETLRDLWVGHIFWVRNVALMTRLGDKVGATVAEENVVKNARAIADSIAPVYGKPAADKLFGLLAGHYGSIKEYMVAAYVGDQKGKDVAVDKVKANATEIAGFLSGANPKWSKDTLVSLLFAHGGHHMAQIDALMVKDYASEAQAWDVMNSHMLMIADALGQGIVKQFPKKF